MTPAWKVCAWPPLLWQAQRTTQLHFIHLGSCLLSPGEPGCPSCGQTFWGGESAEGAAGVAWDWVQVADGVVAMSDPMGLVTNLRLLGPEGEELSALETAVRLNQLVHALPWQSEVQRLLHTPGVA